MANKKIKQIKISGIAYDIVDAAAAKAADLAAVATSGSYNDLSDTPATSIKITYNELKELKDNSQLISGQQYRITDYQCTTTTTNTSSAGHQFDIIVVADDENTLNENARAVIHEGNTYFANSDLSAWELKYSLDNDTDRFAWANSTSGKGVIYWLKDEFNNECPYDFKNILFTGTSYDESISFTNAYTFTYTENSTLKDASLAGLTKYCYNNVIKEYYASSKLQLNQNIFYSTSSTFNCYNNILGTNCRRNTFGNTCCYSTFGGSCYNNTFGSSCQYNFFGGSCYNNTFGNNCTSNTFGTYCYNITFGYSCIINTFGNYCYNNTFGNNCQYNTFGTNCRYSTFGNICQSNTFGNSFQYNLFGDSCYNNTFGNNCQYNTFGTDSGTINYCRYNIIDDNCRYLYINSTDTTATYSNQLQNVHIHLGISGSSSSNRTTITIPDRALSDEYNIIKAGTTTVEI